MLSTSLLAQQASNTIPAPVIETPAPAPAPAAAPTNTAPAVGTNAAAAKAPKKKSAPKKKPAPKAAPKKDLASDLRTVPLVPGPAIVAANNVNVRGQAKLKSEVLARLTKGQPVMVIEEIVRNNSASDEPSAWAKIQLPAGAHAWVNGSFVDATNKTVVPKKLNVRTGPGENYSVLAQLLRGDAVNQLGAKGGWLEIEPPTNACAFMAAQFL